MAGGVGGFNSGEVNTSSSGGVVEGMSAANLAVEGTEGIRAWRGQRHTNPVTFGVDGARRDVQGFSHEVGRKSVHERVLRGIRPRAHGDQGFLAREVVGNDSRLMKGC